MSAIFCFNCGSEVRSDPFQDEYEMSYLSRIHWLFFVESDDVKNNVCFSLFNDGVQQYNYLNKVTSC